MLGPVQDRCHTEPQICAGLLASLLYNLGLHLEPVTCLRTVPVSSFIWGPCLTPSSSSHLLFSPLSLSSRLLLTDFHSSSLSLNTVSEPRTLSDPSFGRWVMITILPHAAKHTVYNIKVTRLKEQSQQFNLDLGTSSKESWLLDLAEIDNRNWISSSSLKQTKRSNVKWQLWRQLEMR